MLRHLKLQGYANPQKATQTHNRLHHIHKWLHKPIKGSTTFIHGCKNPYFQAKLQSYQTAQTHNGLNRLNYKDAQTHKRLQLFHKRPHKTIISCITYYQVTQTHNRRHLRLPNPMNVSDPHEWGNRLSNHRPRRPNCTVCTFKNVHTFSTVNVSGSKWA